MTENLLFLVAFQILPRQPETHPHTTHFATSRPIFRLPICQPAPVSLYSPLSQHPAKDAR
ncbi:hypothetical protein [Kingella sp. (in: b-proteobacteria)]|uniref:hypothetical protein n=1 Tax=Kingella sp. (in: b-proteobacteria) TaxID=2020713 RepID=UPI0026DA8211|nr:hypothetical protein [Kingella sp. (in: b-proteobacteria)]